MRCQLRCLRGPGGGGRRGAGGGAGDRSRRRLAAVTEATGTGRVGHKCGRSPEMLRVDNKFVYLHFAFLEK